MSSSMSNNSNSDLFRVRAISTAAADDEVQFSFVDSSPVDISTPSSVIVSSRTSQSSSSSNIPIQEQVIKTTTTSTKGSGDKKLIFAVDGEYCFVQKEDQETARSVVEAAAAAAVCTDQREDDKKVHSDKKMISSSSRKRNSNCSECDSTGTCTDKYSCNPEEGVKATEDDHGVGVIQKTSTTEYYSSSSPRESTADDQGNHNYHDHHDDEHDNSDDGIDENDDGFRTPTALEHRIPEIRPCPPPPRKQTAVLDRVIRPSTTTSSNRKISSTQHQHRGARMVRGRRLLDFSKEVESMFPPIVKVNLGRKIKKARTV